MPAILPPFPVSHLVPRFNVRIDLIVLGWHDASENEKGRERLQGYIVSSSWFRKKGGKLLSFTIWVAAWQRICFIGKAWRFTSNLLEVLMVAPVIYPALRVLVVKRHPDSELLFSFIMKTFNLSNNSPPSTINNSIIGHTKEICNHSHVRLNFPQHTHL